MAVSYALLLSAACLGANPAGQIAFVSGAEPSCFCACVLEAGSGTVTRVGPGNHDGPPAWSPDGSWLAFHTRGDEGINIYIVHPDGTGPRALPHKYKWNQNPRWSADGRLLAYETEPDDASEKNEGDLVIKRRITVYDLAAGTESIWGGDKAGLMRPVWMPNMKILYALKPDQQIEWDGAQTTMSDLDWLKGGATMIAIGAVGDPGKLSTDIFLVTQDKAAPLPLWVMPSHGNYAEWAVEPSPGGSNIAFESNDGGDREIFMIGKKGAADISNDPADDWNPVWSPNGEWVAFESFRGGRRGIYKVYPETARVSPVAAEANADNWHPTWSPDSKWIAFVSDRTGDPELFLCDASGKKIKQLTQHPGPDYAPAWRPKRKK